MLKIHQLQKIREISRIIRETARNRYPFDGKNLKSHFLSFFQIDSFVLDEHEEETGELSEDSRLDDEDLEEDSEDEDDLDEDEDEDDEDEDLDDLDGVDPNQRFLLRGVAGAAAVAKDDCLDVVGVDPVSGSEIYPPVDPETQAKLEALFETAGIGKLAGETKQFTDPEVRKHVIITTFWLEAKSWCFEAQIPAFLILDYILTYIINFPPKFYHL